MSNPGRLGVRARQQAVHHLAREDQLAVEPALVRHRPLQPGALDGAGDREPVGGEQLRRVVAVAVRIVRPGVQHAQHPVAGAQDRHQQPRTGAGAPLERGGRGVGRDLQRPAGCEHPADRALLLERRIQARDRVIAAAHQRVTQRLAAGVDHVHAGGVGMDERGQPVEDAFEDVLRLAQRRQAERVDHDAGRLHGVRADPDGLLRCGRRGPGLGRHRIYSSACGGAGRKGAAC